MSNEKPRPSGCLIPALSLSAFAAGVAYLTGSDPVWWGVVVFVGIYGPLLAAIVVAAVVWVVATIWDA
jgi:hypothetical protein